MTAARSAFYVFSDKLTCSGLKPDFSRIKNIQQVEHTRHRSVVNAMVNVLVALAAYTHQPRKPSLNLSKNNLKLLTYNL